MGTWRSCGGRGRTVAHGTSNPVKMFLGIGTPRLTPGCSRNHTIRKNAVHRVHTLYRGRDDVRWHAGEPRGGGGHQGVMRGWAREHGHQHPHDPATSAPTKLCNAGHKLSVCV